MPLLDGACEGCAALGAGCEPAGAPGLVGPVAPGAGLPGNVPAGELFPLIGDVAGGGLEEAGPLGFEPLGPGVVPGVVPPLEVSGGPDGPGMAGVGLPWPLFPFGEDEAAGGAPAGGLPAGVALVGEALPAVDVPGLTCSGFAEAVLDGPGAAGVRLVAPLGITGPGPPSPPGMVKGFSPEMVVVVVHELDVLLLAGDGGGGGGYAKTGVVTGRTVCRRPPT